MSKEFIPVVKEEVQASLKRNREFLDNLEYQAYICPLCHDDHLKSDKSKCLDNLIKEESELGMMAYFWSEMGDIERYYGWDRVRHKYSGLNAAVEAHKKAEMEIDSILKAYSEQIANKIRILKERK